MRTWHLQGGLDLTGGLGARNAGVEGRNSRDVEQLQTEEKREAESYAALQRKACPYSVMLPTLQRLIQVWCQEHGLQPLHM